MSILAILLWVIGAVAVVLFCLLVVPLWSSVFAAAPFKFMRRIARRFDSSHMVGYTIAKNIRVTPEELDNIAGDSNQYLRSLVAAHPQANHDTLRILARDESRMVRLRILENPRAPEDLSALVALEMMAEGPSSR